MRHTHLANYRQAGFSLIEMAVSMLIMGIILSIILSVVMHISNRGSGIGQSGRADTQGLLNISGQTTQAGPLSLHTSLELFIQQKFRLPCPDVNNDGLEDCGSGNLVGRVPHLTMKLSQAALDSRDNPIRYALFRKANSDATLDADLGLLKNRFVPRFPTDPPSANNYSYPATENILDFCRALENAPLVATATQPHTRNGTTVVNAAYILVSGGETDASYSGSFFDGINGSGFAFEPSDKAPVASYDDLVSARSFLALYQKLDCVSRIGEVIGASLDARVAETVWVSAKVATCNAGMALELAERGVERAIFDQVMADLNVLSATTSSVIAIMGVSEWNFLAVAQTVVAGVAITTAIAQVVSTGIALDNANTLRDDSQATLDTYRDVREPKALTDAKDRYDYAAIVEANGGMR